MKCPICNEEIEPISEIVNNKIVKYCPNCGEVIEDDIPQNNKKVLTSTSTKKDVYNNPIATKSLQNPQNQQSYDNRYYSGGYQKPLCGGTYGVLLVLFLGIGGLILCCAIGDEDCKRAAKTIFIILLLIGFFVGIIYLYLIASVLNGL